MWIKWFPWKFVLRRVARAQGFIDPILLLSRFNRFAQPSDVLAPLELLRAGVVLHARGLINSQVIQHNLDWVWPYWVERQFDPTDQSFIPRAFSLTHINLTHRNWTAVGVPDCLELPIVDPRGLVMPFFDSWSIDCWVVTRDGKKLLPSKNKTAEQYLDISSGIAVVTETENDGLRLRTRVEMLLREGKTFCRIEASATAPSEGWLIFALRPYNPEGVSFIHRIAFPRDRLGWRIDGKDTVRFDCQPQTYRFSEYRRSDVYHWLWSTVPEKSRSTKCEVGLATAMVGYEISQSRNRQAAIEISLDRKPAEQHTHPSNKTAQQVWHSALDGACRLTAPESVYGDLYEKAIRTIVLHSPLDTYAGPYTYRRFWFRDAAFIVRALLCAGFAKRAFRVIERFMPRQKASGYFESQDGEWDSNGQALWTMYQYCLLTGIDPPLSWCVPVERGAAWILKKRTPKTLGKPHAGLMPSGFSAEHLGPNDHYYWDNFWSVAGLQAAAWLLRKWKCTSEANGIDDEARSYLECIEQSLSRVAGPNRKPAMPASPYRRLDSGAVGSLVAGYPLQLWPPDNERLLLTAEYLADNCLIDGAFYHDISHSGINPYLNLHIAQVFLRAGNIRFAGLSDAIAKIASPTGQWPEAIHPITKNGCMGDGQHVWAAAEWVLMVRNSFVREELNGKPRLVLCAGVTEQLLKSQGELMFGPAPTPFGPVTISIRPSGDSVIISWVGTWFETVPRIEIAFPGYTGEQPQPGVSEILVRRI